MKKVRLTEVHDDRGVLRLIMANEVDTGEHVLDAICGPYDVQSPEARAEFREWFADVLKRKNYVPIN